MELFFVYLWLKLDSIIDLMRLPLIILIPMFIVGLMARAELSYDVSDSANAVRKWHTRLGIYIFVAAVLGTFLPSSKDMAILVGSHIAIETIKSPEGEKVGKLIRKKANEFLDEQLKEVKK